MNETSAYSGVCLELSNRILKHSMKWVRFHAKGAEWIKALLPDSERMYGAESNRWPCEQKEKGSPLHWEFNEYKKVDSCPSIVLYITEYIALYIIEVLRVLTCCSMIMSVHKARCSKIWILKVWVEELWNAHSYAPEGRGAAALSHNGILWHLAIRETYIWTKS